MKPQPLPKSVNGLTVVLLVIRVAADSGCFEMSTLQPIPPFARQSIVCMLVAVLVVSAHAAPQSARAPAEEEPLAPFVYVDLESFAPDMDPFWRKLRDSGIREVVCEWPDDATGDPSTALPDLIDAGFSVIGVAGPLELWLPILDKLEIQPAAWLPVTDERNGLHFQKVRASGRSMLSRARSCGEALQDVRRP